MARLHALFIGNSFTARNDVPGLIASMARARAHALTYRLISRGGASLRSHYNGPDALPAIRSGRFDAVILQEQSTLPVKNAARMHESIRLFDAAIREAAPARPIPAGADASPHPCRLVLYLTWARRHSPQHQQVITDAYLSIARELDAPVAPAGIAWQRLLAEHPAIALHDKDQSHPTLAGSYLAACTLFAALFGGSPLGVPAPAALEPALVTLLQQTAHAVCG